MPILVDDIALYFPELKFVASHTGWPWCEELIALAWKHSNVFIGTCAHKPKYWDPKLVQFINSRGRGKVMWGTDYPILMPQECIDQIDELGLKPEAREQLLVEYRTDAERTADALADELDEAGYEGAEGALRGDVTPTHRGGAQKWEICSAQARGARWSISWRS